MKGHISVNTEAHVGYIDVEVDINLDELVEQLDDEDRFMLLQKLQGCVPHGAGDGDRARDDHLTERAFLAAKRLPQVPRELTELFYLVHGRACA